MYQKYLRSSTMLSPRGNIFFALFGAVALVGILGASVMNFMKGPLATSVKLTKMNTAENQMAIGAQVAVMASANQANSGDCDSDTYVEPLPWRTATTEPKPTNGGLIPLNLGMSKKDPWGTEYGYCAWNHGGTLTGGGCTANLLAGTNNNIYPVVAIVSAGPDKTFTTTCRTFATADANSDGDLLDAGDNDLVSKAATSDDDIIFTYTYQEATGAAGGLWSLKAGVPSTATIDKDIEVQGKAVFTGAGNFGGGILLPDKTLINCNDIVNNGVMAKNGTAIEICDGAGTWTAIGGGGGSIDDLTDGVTSYGTDDNIFMGQNAGNGIVAGATNNLSIGVGAFIGNKTNLADNNIAIGNSALAASTAAGNNIAIGMGAGDAITTGSGNIAIGNGTIGWGGSTNPSANVVIGSNAAAQSNMGNMSDNVVIGSFSYYQAAQSASENVAIGSNAMREIRASSNVAVGSSAMREAGAGTGGTAVGWEAMRYANSSTTAYTSANTAVGYQALRGSTTPSANIGTGNTAIGYQSLLGVTSGSNNIAIGDKAADAITTGSNNITIGQNVDAVSATGSNQLNIGNTIYGDLSTDTVGIGTTAPVVTLDASGKTDAIRPTVGTSVQRPPCNSTTSGVFRWNSSNAQLEVCDGSQWLTPNMVSAGTAGMGGPNAFSFTNLTGQALSSAISSNTVTLAGSFAGPLTAQCTGQCVAIARNGVWGTSPMTGFVSGDTIAIRVNTPNTFNTTITAGVNVGNTSSGTWSVTTTAANVAACQTGISPRQLCPDGTIYVGLSPDGNEPMYRTYCNSGWYPNGTSCSTCGAGLWSGSGTTCDTTFATSGSNLTTWNNGSGSYTNTGVTSAITGRANTTILAGLNDAGSPHKAARYCDNLVAYGYSDWYLPATNEALMLGNAGVPIWSSTESSANVTVAVINLYGSQNTYSKNSGSIYAHCTRRGAVTSPAGNPNAFSFTNVTGQALNSSINSNQVMLTGGFSSSTATCSGSCTAIARNGVWGGTSVSGFVSGDTIAIRVTSSSSVNTPVTATVTVGGTTSGTWSVTTTTTAPCQAGIAPSGICPDGTMYVGLTPDGSLPTYTTRCSAGFYWNGTSCTGCGVGNGHWTGSGTSCNTTYGAGPTMTYNNGSTNYTYLGTVTSMITGRANSNALATTSDASAPYRAAQYCENLTAFGYSDWYLPAGNEISLLSFVSTGDATGTRISSTENGNQAYFVTSAGIYLKSTGYPTQCFRAGAVATSCPSGYTSNAGRCYKKITVAQNTISWSAARTSCQGDGADLVTINDATENSYVHGFAGGDGTYLGRTDTTTEGTWVWLDTSSSYSNWASGEPNGSTTENCLGMLFGNPEHHDVPCGNNQYNTAYVCERAP